MLRFSPVVILFVEDVTQSSTGLQLPSEQVMLQLWRSASSYEKEGSIVLVLVLVLVLTPTPIPTPTSTPSFKNQ